MKLVEALAKGASPFLAIPFVRRVRRNHGLEHATIHLLARRAGQRGETGFRMAGRSDGSGFILLGEVETAAVERAVQDALARMRNGEHGLAIHPNCGTNLLTAGVLASLAALAGTAGAERSARGTLERFPTVVLMVVGALVLAPLLGTDFQRYFTTLGEPGDLEVVSVQQREMSGPLGGKMTVHRVTTANG